MDYLFKLKKKILYGFSSHFHMSPFKKKLSRVKAEKIAGKLMIYPDTHVIYSSSFFS